MTNPRLLIIDDEVAFSKFVSRVASAAGFDVEITTCAKDFMSAVLRGAPDVVILDIIMPGMDGIELIQWLARQQISTRIIVVTGFDPSYGDMVKDLGTANGIASIAVLVKPISVATLKAVLKDSAKA